MDKTLQIAFRLRNTYRVNSILYALRSLPVLKKLLPEDLYHVRAFKGFANFVSALWAVVSIFLGKGLYYGLIAVYVGMACSRSAAGDAFAHVFLFLTLIGGFTNTSLFDPSRDKYYAIILMRMDANRYVLYRYAYDLFRILVGSVPFAFYFGLRDGLPAWGCVLLPLGVMGYKLAVAAWSLFDYERKGLAYNENRLGKIFWLAVVLLLAAGYLPPVFGFAVPAEAVCGLMGAFALAGALSVRKVFSFRRYREIVQQLTARSMQQMDSAAAAGQKQQASLIDNLSATSRKKGLAYLNDLFVKRHRKILWKASLRQTAVFAIAACLGAGALLALPGAREAARPVIEALLPRALPYLVFIMYAVNRGSGFTKALFFNCDRSLLTYPCFKAPRPLLRLFAIRLRGIIAVNLLPAGMLAAGLAVIAALAGCRLGILGYLVFILALLALSVFFSVHYLVLYYLMQPYNAGTEMKSPAYAMVCSLTYFAAFFCMRLEVPLYWFGGLCILFCAAYCGIACLLVYRFAPGRFRIRT